MIYERNYGTLIFFFFLYASINTYIDHYNFTNQQNTFVHISSSSSHSSSFMDADDEIVKVAEIQGTNFIRKDDLSNQNLCYLNVGAKLFTRMIYREPNRPDVLVEQTIYGGTRRILNTCLPENSRNSRLAFREQIILHEPHLGNPGNALISGPNRSFSANDIDWNIVSETLSKYAKHSGAFPERGRKDVFGVRGDIAFGDTECLCCHGSYDFQDPNHIHRVVELPCRHVFHKACIYKWIWINQVYNSNNNNSYCYCPTCDSFIC